MGKSSKKPRKKFDPKQYSAPSDKPKKEHDVDGDDIFKEMLRSKPHRR